MDSIERIIQVSWRHRVFFADDIFNVSSQVLHDVLASEPEAAPRRALVILDEALAHARPELSQAIQDYFAAHSQAAILVAPPQRCCGGEAAKASWSLVNDLLTAIDRYHIDRHSYLIAVGGGALLDLAGLAAATAHRGVRHIRVPTTTLSQCDSGVGVKNGINAFGKKNFIGTFAPPFAVINDFQLLRTLPPADLRAGFVEAVKVACIRSGDFFAELERDATALARFDSEPMRRLIRRCAELHINHIVQGGDPFEAGSARPLDFGHWAAHKLEQMSGFTLRHGEAVAVGLALDVIYSRRAGFLSSDRAERVLSLLETLGFELFHSGLRQSKGGRLEVLAGLEEFREHLGGQLAVTLLREIGEGFEVHEMDPVQVTASIAELESRHEARGRS